MLSQQQITNFITKAKSQGYSDADIKAEIARKQKEISQVQTSASSVPAPVQSPMQNQVQTTPPVSQQMPAPTQPATQQAPVTVQVNTPTQPTTSSVTNEQPQGGFVSNFFKSLVAPAFRYAKFVGEGVGQGARELTFGSERDTLMQKVQNGGVLTPEEQKRLEQLTSPIFMNNKEFERLNTPGGIAMEGLKSAAGAASYLIPAGRGTSLIANGAVQGALFGLGTDETQGVDVESLLTNTVGGAVGAGALGLGGKVIGGAKGLLAKGAGKIAENVAESAAQGINKATPSMWTKAMVEHGLDLNVLTAKYFPKGGTYETVLGKSGTLQKVIGKAEEQIATALKGTNANTKIPMDDFVKILRNEQKELAKMPGNEPAQQALDQFIEAFQSKYKEGIAPKRLLELKRAADSVFGRAVVDETAGSTIAQAQKMFANSARAKLKTLFPKIKDALDTETEVYTLKPVLERARGVTKTRGSELRVGKFSNLTDLINPIKYIDAALANPKVASNFLKNEVGQETGAAAKNTVKSMTSSGLKSKVQEGIGPRLTSEIGAVMASDSSTVSSTDPGKSQFDYTNLQPSTTKTSLFEGRTKQDILLEASAQGATTQDLEEISKRYDLLAGSNGTNQKLSENQQKFKAAGEIAKNALTALDEGGITTGVLASPFQRTKEKLTGQTSKSTKFSGQLAAVRGTVLSALSGANVPPSEYERLSPFIPEDNDPPELIRSKLQVLIPYLNSYLPLQ